jgi:hypothetical protein
MKMNILAIAVARPDRDLLARLPALAGNERTATAELVAHLAALRLRPSLYAAQGYGSLFAYCRHALRFSEDAASNRIHAARACLKFPLVLELLASGELSLSAVRILRPHLTMENHERILGRARNARKADIERLVAELAPRPDVPSSVRRLALPRTSGPQPLIIGEPSQTELSAVAMGASKDRITPADATGTAGINDATGTCPGDIDPTRTRAGEMDSLRHGTPCVPRPVVQPLSPERYRVQFTIGQDAHDSLRRLQTLLRREIPDGDAGAIFERALRLLHEAVEAAKFGRAPKGKEKAPKRRERVPVGRERAPVCGDKAPKSQDGAPESSDRFTQGATAVTPTTIPAYDNRIRPGADARGTSSASWSVTRATNAPQVKSAASARSRYIPRAVRRAVWYRDGGQCAFVSVSGQRCLEHEFLELHHIQPYALKGPATAANIALRCRLHNAYEADVVFGARGKLRYRRSERHEPPG